jgi:hypothetical protein
MPSTVIQGCFPSALPRAGVVQCLPNGTAARVPAHLARFSSAGQPLPVAVQRKMESAFRTSFADVRVHVGPQAAAIGAHAFTKGTDIHFAPGQYDPSSPRGERILAHELAHVVQQRAGRVPNPFGNGVAIVQDRLLEAEAERMSARVAQTGPAQPGAQPGVAQPYKVVPPHRVAARKQDLIGRITPSTPGVVVRGNRQFQAQERRGGTGFLNRAQTGANIVEATGVSVRVSDDGRMAIEDSNLSNRQPKTVYLADAVFAASNRALTAAGSSVELIRTGKTLRVYTSPNQFLDLKQVVPRRRGSNAAPSLAFTAPQNCNEMGTFVTGRNVTSGMDTPSSTVVGGNRTTVMDEVHEAVVQYIATQLNTSTGNHVHTLENTPVLSVNPMDRVTRDNAITALATEYVAALGAVNQVQLDQELRALGINRYADPRVGEAFVIHTTASQDHLGRIRDIASGRQFVPDWTYHFGGVIAKSGVDYVTLENYARSGSDPRGANPSQDPRWYFQMYSGNQGQSFHEANVAIGGYANPVTMRLARPRPPVIVAPILVPPPQPARIGWGSGIGLGVLFTGIVVGGLRRLGYI